MAYISLLSDYFMCLNVASTVVSYCSPEARRKAEASCVELWVAGANKLLR